MDEPFRVPRCEEFLDLRAERAGPRRPHDLFLELSPDRVVEQEGRFALSLHGYTVRRTTI